MKSLRRKYLERFLIKEVEDHSSLASVATFERSGQKNPVLPGIELDCGSLKI